jgi:hypothetical protein
MNQSKNLTQIVDSCVSSTFTKCRRPAGADHRFGSALQASSFLQRSKFETMLLYQDLPFSSCWVDGHRFMKGSADHPEDNNSRDAISPGGGEAPVSPHLENGSPQDPFSPLRPFFRQNGGWSHQRNCVNLFS